MLNSRPAVPRACLASTLAIRPWQYEPIRTGAPRADFGPGADGAGAAGVLVPGPVTVCCLGQRSSWASTRSTRARTSISAVLPGACALIHWAALNASLCAVRWPSAGPTSHLSLDSGARLPARRRRAPVDLARHQEAGGATASHCAHAVQHRDRLRRRVQIDFRQRERHDEQIRDADCRLEMFPGLWRRSSTIRS